MTEKRGKRLPRSWRPDPAPGDLHLVQALINTRRLQASEDDLRSPADLSAWLSAYSLAPSETPLDEASLKQAREIREGLRALLRSHNAERLASGVIADLNRGLLEARLQVRFDSRGVPCLESPGSGWPGGLNRLLAATFEAMGEGIWERLKACREPACQMAFYDASSNRSGIWCSSRRCGNRLHGRTYRRRHFR